jgi:penicillin amidase
MGARLTPHLLLAIDRAQAERASPGSDPSLAALVTDPSYLPERIEAVRELLAGWEDLGYQAAAGVDLDTNQPLPADDADARASQATMIFNAWLVRVLRRTFGDELAHLERESLPREIEAKALLRLMEADPATLATYDPATLDSAVWDDLDTPEVESRHQRMIRALLDALALLEEDLGDDPDGWRWGLRHTVRFAALVPLYGKLSIPASGDDQFPSGFPRHGDNFAVDSSDYDISVAIDETPSFSYAHGPAQRFVVEMDPSGPRAWNALPGGAVWDHQSPHFADEAELWRKNQTHPVPFVLEDVIEAAEKRTVFAAP